jgi:hypothetical protein
VKGIKTFPCNDFEFLTENSTIRGVANQSDPKYVTEEEMKWMLQRIKNHGHTLDQIVKASEKNIDAFRLLAFLEVAFYQTSLTVERDKEKRTLGFYPDFFLEELSRVKLPAMV